MNTFTELYGIDSANTLKFFIVNLRDEIGGRDITNKEIVYVASILAHYARTSCDSTSDIPPLSNLLEVLENFIFDRPYSPSPTVLEIGGSQCLLLNGFFRDQMKRRHNTRWHDQIGQTFYDRASELESCPTKKVLFGKVAKNFELLALGCRDMHRRFRNNRFLLRLDWPKC